MGEQPETSDPYEAQANAIRAKLSERLLIAPKLLTAGNGEPSDLDGLPCGETRGKLRFPRTRRWPNAFFTEPRLVSLDGP